MNENNSPETLSALQDDASSLYGRLYADQRIGGAATLDDLLDVMGIVLRIAQFFPEGK